MVCPEGEMVRKIGTINPADPDKNRLGIHQFSLQCSAVNKHIDAIHEDSPRVASPQNSSHHGNYHTEGTECDDNSELVIGVWRALDDSLSGIEMGSYCYKTSGQVVGSPEEKGLIALTGGQCKVGEVMFGVQAFWDESEQLYTRFTSLCRNFNEIKLHTPFNIREDNVRTNTPGNRVADAGIRRQCDARLNVSIEAGGETIQFSSAVFNSIGTAIIPVTGELIAKRRARAAAQTCVKQWFSGQLPGHLGDCTNNGVWAANDNNISENALENDFDSVFGDLTTINNFISSEALIKSYNNANNKGGGQPSIKSWCDKVNNSKALTTLTVSLEQRKKGDFSDPTAANPTPRAICANNGEAEFKNVVINPLCGYAQDPSATICSLSPDATGPGGDGVCGDTNKTSLNSKSKHFLQSPNGDHKLYIRSTLEIEHTKTSKSTPIYKYVFDPDEDPDICTDRKFINPNGSARAREGQCDFTDVMAGIIDGEFVLYNSNAVPMWNTGTKGSGASHLLLKDDGNLYLECFDGRPVWTTNKKTPTLTLSCETNIEVSEELDQIELGLKDLYVNELFCENRNNLGAAVSKDFVCPNATFTQFLGIDISGITLQQRDIQHFGVLSGFLDRVIADKQVAVLGCLGRASTTTNKCFVSKDDPTVLEQSLFREQDKPTQTADPSNPGPNQANYLTKFNVNENLHTNHGVFLPNMIYKGGHYIVNECHRRKSNAYFTDSVDEIFAFYDTKGEAKFIERYLPRIECQFDRAAEESFVNQYSDYINGWIATRAISVKVAETVATLAAFIIAEVITDGGATISFTEGLITTSTREFLSTAIGRVFIAQMVLAFYNDLNKLAYCDSGPCRDQAIADLATQTALIAILGVADKFSGGAVERAKSFAAEVFAKTFIDFAGEFLQLEAGAAKRVEAIYRLRYWSTTSKSFGKLAKFEAERLIANKAPVDPLNPLNPLTLAFKGLDGSTLKDADFVRVFRSKLDDIVNAKLSEADQVKALKELAAEIKDPATFIETNKNSASLRVTDYHSCIALLDATTRNALEKAFADTPREVMQLDDFWTRVNEFVDRAFKGGKTLIENQEILDLTSYIKDTKTLYEEIKKLPNLPADAFKDPTFAEAFEQVAADSDKSIDERKSDLGELVKEYLEFLKCDN